MKTAVEYYNQEIKELFNMHQDGEISGKMFHMSRLVALTKAKAMEKGQIMKAFYKGRQEEQYKNLFNNHVRKSEEQYYNETYESNT